MAGKMNTKVRLVKCPRCLVVLPEPPDVPVYACGGCGAKLQGKKRNNSTVDTTSQRPDGHASRKQKVDRVFVDQEAGSSSNQQPLLNSTDESDRNSGHIDLHSSNEDQDAAKRAENSTVDAPPTVVEECSSEKLKEEQLSDNQEPCCSSNQQSVVNSSNEPDQNIHNDPRSSTEFSGHEDPESSPEATAHNRIDLQQEQNQKQDQSNNQDAGKQLENVAVVGLEHSAGKQKTEQLSADNESINRFAHLLLVNPMNGLDQNNDRSERGSSSDLSYHEDPESSPEATVHNRMDQQQEQNQKQDQSNNQDAGKQLENVAVIGLEHSSGKQKTEQLSADNESINRFAHLLLVNPMNELDHNNDRSERGSSSELSYHEDPESSPEATVHNRIDQQEQERNQIHYQDVVKKQENIAVVGLEHSSGKQKTEQLSDENETGNRFTQLYVVNPMNEPDRNNDHSEHRSSSELSYHDNPKSSPEATVNTSVKHHETEFVSCRKETEIEESGSEFEDTIANMRIISDSDGGSKSSFRIMIAEKLLDTRQKKAVYPDEDDLLSKDGNADLRHRRRFGRISSVESMETTRLGGTSYYGYEGSVSSFDGNDDQIPRKNHIGSIRDEHVDSGNRSRFNRRNGHPLNDRIGKYEHRSTDVRPFYDLNEFHENPRHHPSMIAENPKMERIELLKLVRELQEQLERTNISNPYQVPSYYEHVLNNAGRHGQRMAFSGEATMVNRRRDSSSCHHCCPQDRHFSAQVPSHHVCCKHSHSESDFSAADDHWQQNDVRKPFRSPKKKQYVRPIAGGSPWITCYRCFKLLQLPQSFLLFHKRYHSLRCGACLKVLNFTLTDGTHVSRYYPEETMAAPPSSEAEDDDKVARSLDGPVSCSDRSFQKSYSTETDRNGSREFSEERRKATMSRDPSSSTRPPSSRISGRRTTTSEIEEVNGSPLHWLMGYASPSKVIRGL